MEETSQPYFYSWVPRNAQGFFQCSDCYWVVSHTVKQEGNFLSWEHAALFLHSAAEKISRLSPHRGLSFCPQRGPWRIGLSQWKPTLLMRLCRVQKCINHLMIQGSMWPLIIWGWGPCLPQTTCRKVWAAVSGSCWAPEPPRAVQELAHAVPACAFGTGSQESFSCSLC